MLEANGLVDRSHCGHRLAKHLVRATPSAFALG
jgi:hypothetical protein